MFGSGTHPLDLAKRTILIISNEEMSDIMETVKSFEESFLLIKGINETMTIKQNNKKEDFLECY